MKNSQNNPVTDKDIPFNLKNQKDLESGKDEEVEISPEELELLEKTENSAGEEDENLARASLDHKDDDGEELNEQDGFSGKDLDVPGSEDDDDNEEIGEEDEENNNYSLGGDGKDD